MSLSRDIFFDYYLTIIWKKNTKQWFQMIAKDFCPMLFVAKEKRSQWTKVSMGNKMLNIHCIIQKIGAGVICVMFLKEVSYAH